MASCHALQTQEYAKPANDTPHENLNELWRHQSRPCRVFEPLLADVLARLSFEHLRICIWARRSENWNTKDGQQMEFEGLEPKSWCISSECQWWAASIWRVWNPCSRNHNLPIDGHFASSDRDRRKCGKPQNLKTKFSFFVYLKALNDKTNSFLKRIVSRIFKSCRSWAQKCTLG